MDVAVLYVALCCSGIAYTLVILFRYGRWRSARVDWSTAIGIPLIIAAMILTSFPASGRPMNLAGVVAILALVLIAMLVHQPRFVRNLSAVLITCWGVGMIALWMLSTTTDLGVGRRRLPTAPYYAGSTPEVRKRHQTAKQRGCLASICRELTTATENNSTNYSAQWLAESPIATHLPNKFQTLRGCGQLRLVRSMRCWHTPITQMYRYEVLDIALWYPGGSPQQAIPRITYRPVNDARAKHK